MEEELEKIKRMINSGEIEEAIRLLDQLLAAHPEKRTAAVLYYLLGNAHRKQGNWQYALNNYQEAIALDAESPAVEARHMMMDIMNFYNKDMFNQ